MVTRGERLVSHTRSRQEKNRILTEDNSIPPLGNLRIAGHKTGMDIRLLMHGTTGLGPDLLAEIEEGMGKGSRDGREGETVGDGESGRDEQWAVGIICFLVEGGIGIDDFGDVVLVTLVVEGTAGRDGHELSVPGVGEVEDGCQEP